MKPSSPECPPVCPKCSNQYSSFQGDRLPKMLKCGHEICEKCLLEMFEINSFVKCPICGQLCEDEDPNYENAFALAKTLIPNEKSDHHCVIPNCNQVDNKTKWCFHCDRYLCDQHYQEDRQTMLKKEVKPILRKSESCICKMNEIVRKIDKTTADLTQKSDSKLQHMLTILKEMQMITNVQLPKLSAQRKHVLNNLSILLESKEMLSRSLDNIDDNCIISSMVKQLQKSKDYCKSSLTDDVSEQFEFQSEDYDQMCHNITQLINMKDLSRYYLLSNCQNVVKSDCCYWKIENVNVLLTEDSSSLPTSCLESPHFYTSDGYNLRIEMKVNQMDYPGYVGLFVGICSGEHDSTVIWPFPDTIVVSVLNNDGEREESVVFCKEMVWKVEDGDETFQKPRERNNIGAGNVTFMKKDRLLSDQFVKNGSVVVIIQCGVVKFPENNGLLTINKELNKGENSYTWQLSNIELKKLTNRTLYSPFFETTGSYRFLMIVNLNEKDEEDRSYISISMSIVKSDRDEELTWPFESTVRLELVIIEDPRTTGPNVELSFYTAANKYKDRFFGRQIDSIHEIGTGKLIEHTEVFLSDRHKYIDDDTDSLYFRFTIL